MQAGSLVHFGFCKRSFRWLNDGQHA